MTTTTSAAPETQAPVGATAVPTRTLGILSLVLGISSIVFGLLFVVPVAAIVLGVLALRQEPASRGMAIGGIVTAAVALSGFVFAGLGILLALPFAGLFALGLPWL